MRVAVASVERDLVDSVSVSSRARSVLSKTPQPLGRWPFGPVFAAGGRSGAAPFESVRSCSFETWLGSKKGIQPI